MQLKAGLRLMCTGCTTELVVVKAPDVEVDFRCGKEALVEVASREAPPGHTDVDEGGGTVLGKRYSDESSGLEVLCTKPGTGTLSSGGAPLGQNVAKQLPSSD